MRGTSPHGNKSLLFPFKTPMQNRIIENYCSGVYLSPDQVVQLLKDMEQDPKVLEDLEGLWSNGQIAVLKKSTFCCCKVRSRSVGSH